MGCFWCTEAVFQQLKGVVKVTSGYAGGSTINPRYDDVCLGTTGHAEVSQIEYDPEMISLNELLYVFWRLHDPTTLNRQGADHGTQYRSIILYENDEERVVIQQSMMEAQDLFSDPIVTEITKLEKFYPAEDYHQDYYKDNREYPYCRFVIDPKIEKLKKIKEDIN